jgi:hypothetical protein
MYSNTAHIYQQSKLPGMDLFLLDIMLQKLGMSCITTSGPYVTIAIVHVHP